jgi:hypothetical protein
MRFSVSVPVLSRQIVCTAPSPSTTFIWRIRMPRFSIRRSPSERVVVATIGSPSGTAATASASASFRMTCRV